MATCVEKYAQLLRRLMPDGRAWEAVKDVLDLWDGLAVELCRIRDRADTLLQVEFDPNQTDELLQDWMDLVGIPDECTPFDLTIEEIRQQIAQKLATLGGLSAAYYEEIASFYGFDITVTNLIPFRVGRARVGDPLSNDRFPRDQFRVGSHRVGDQLKIPGWVHYFQARLPISELTKFRVGTSRAGDPLVEFHNALLECTIQKLKPAHSGVIFTFGG